MKIETLTVELRPRSSWEAMELGSALVRQHARAIWVPWLLVTGPVFVLLNLAAWAVGHIWLAWLLMWWLRPAFDRIPMYVLSRAVFGSVPGIAETLRAQLHWGWRPMRGHLTWRRLSPLRAAMLPIDLLEGSDPARLGQRRRVVGGGMGGHAVQLTLVCVNFIIALQLSLLLLTAIAVPNELLPEAARAAWAMVAETPPAWALIALNLLDFIAVAFIEPFYVGAGFGLYLNRRTQLEAWDLEIAFRRMRKRLEAAAGAAVLALALLLPIAVSSPAVAQETAQGSAQRSKTEKGAADTPVAADTSPGTNRKTEGAGDAAVEPSPAGKNGGDAAAVDDEDEDDQDDAPVQTSTLSEIFGEDAVGERSADYVRFDKAVDKAYQDPLLRPKLQQQTWERRDRDKKKKDEKKPEGEFPKLAWLAALVGFIGEYGLWLLVAVLVVALAVTAKRWWPWLLGAAARAEPEPAPVESSALAHAEPLPPDIATVARRLWAEGQPRRALALLYRASVEAMIARVDAHPPPGATEADCLRLSRRLPEQEDREIFQRTVRIWQYAAYGQRLPDAATFESLVQTLAQRFGWAS